MFAPRSSDEPEAKPLSAREWTQLEQKFALNSFNQAELPGSSAERLGLTLQIDNEEAEHNAMEEGHLPLATPYSPHASFNVGKAMARNKLIYALSDYGLVIASDAQKGGTWAGAEEALKAGWIPVFVVERADVPEGNKALIKRGAIPFPVSFEDAPSSLASWLDEHIPMTEPATVQGRLF